MEGDVKEHSSDSPRFLASGVRSQCRNVVPGCTDPELGEAAEESGYRDDVRILM
jgi:hypothetical protein